MHTFTITYNVPVEKKALKRIQKRSVRRLRVRAVYGRVVRKTLTAGFCVGLSAFMAAGPNSLAGYRVASIGLLVGVTLYGAMKLNHPQPPVTPRRQGRDGHGRFAPK